MSKAIQFSLVWSTMGAILLLVVSARAEGDPIVVDLKHKPVSSEVSSSGTPTWTSPSFDLGLSSIKPLLDSGIEYRIALKRRIVGKDTGHFFGSDESIHFTLDGFLEPLGPQTLNFNYEFAFTGVTGEALSKVSGTSAFKSSLLSGKSASADVDRNVDLINPGGSSSFTGIILTLTFPDGTNVNNIAFDGLTVGFDAPKVKVPEPGSLASLALGLSWFAAAARRRTRRSGTASNVLSEDAGYNQRAEAQ